MTDPALALTNEKSTLPSLIARASSALASATTAAEVLEARDTASMAYDAAKRIARLAKAKEAHDEVIAAVYRAQADALLIESQAKARLADEYDAAQERGEVTTRSDQNLLPGGKKVCASDIGLTHKQIHEARKIRDAEKAEPGITEKILNDKIAHGEEPTRAAVRKEIRKKSAAKKHPLDDAEWEQQRKANADALPQHVKNREVHKSKPKTGLSDAERIAELEESVRVLEAENAALKAENKAFSEMKVQFEKGGFAEVIAGKDEQIRILERQVERESDKKVANLRRGDKFYKILNEKYHHFDDVVLKLDEPANG